MGHCRLHRAAVFAAALGLALCCNSALAAQIPTSLGSVVLTGNDANPSGSFRVQVDYSVYDGADPGDPLGVTADYQIVFQLTHLGSDGENPALSIGRFTVFAPDQTVPYYTSIQSVHDVGLKTPSLMQLQPPNTHRGLFYFQDIFVQADFDPGNVSDLLVLTTSPVNLPSSVIIEGNYTDTVPGIHADTIIDLVPEPGMASLVLLGATVLLRQRRGTDR